MAKLRLRVEGESARIEDVVVEIADGPYVSEQVRDCVRRRIPAEFPLSEEAARSRFTGTAELRFRVNG